MPADLPLLKLYPLLPLPLPLPPYPEAAACAEFIQASMSLGRMLSSREKWEVRWRWLAEARLMARVRRQCCRLLNGESAVVWDPGTAERGRPSSYQERERDSANS